MTSNSHSEKALVGHPSAITSWFSPGLLVLAIVVHVALAAGYNFTQDDAYITFRYAENFVGGHGLVFNVGERVEGYTNFFWLILMILGRLFGFDLAVFSRILGVVCGVGTIGLSYLLSGLVFEARSLWRGASSLLLGAAYSFAYWSVAGLETAAFGLAVVCSLYLYLRRSSLAGPVLVLATLLRPEGGLVFVFIAAYEIISRRSFSRYVLVIGGLYITCLMPYLIFKQIYFGGLLPNPFYAKAGFTVGKLRDGLEYTGLYFWHYLGAGLFVLPALFAVKHKGKGVHVFLLVFVAVYTLYVMLIGGDVLKVHRFFIPVMPVMAVLVISGLRILPARGVIMPLGAIGLLLWQSLMPRDQVETFHFAETELTSKMELLAENLLTHDSTNFTLATSTIGMISYRLVGHTVIDMLGLTDTTIARHPEPRIEGLETTWKERQFNTPYLLSRQPDYILFSTGMKPSAPAERTLFLYSQFLRNYRTIAFFFGAFLHDIYKRYYPIEGEIKRDIDVNFVQNFNRAVNLCRSRNYREGVAAYRKAEKYLPEPIYPCIDYYVAEAYRQSGDHQTSYNMLIGLLEKDSLIYQVYRDLYVYEFQHYHNYERAMHFRSRVAGLIPWYVPRLDSLARRMI